LNAAETDTPKLRVARGQALGLRETQEDSLEFRLHGAGVLAVVADGMGGHAAGDVASQAAVAGFVAAFAARSDLAAPERLAAALSAGNLAISRALARGEGGAGMGCTLSAVFAQGAEAAWINVGDSPILAWSRGEGLRRVSSDHSMAPVLDELARKGVMSFGDAKSDPDRHALRSALRGGAIELTDQGVTPLAPGAMLLIASDGLDVLDEAGIDAQLRHAGGDADRVVSNLLAAVAAAGSSGQDNVSVIAICRPDDPGKDAQPRWPRGWLVQWATRRWPRPRWRRSP
jgi:serine/threonine protein phosphatase PrpC